MNFIQTVKLYFDKLSDTTVTTHLWKEVISGKNFNIPQDRLIEYSFHYPVDTDVYLEELNQKLDDSIKEDLKTIDGNLKAYLQTFIYYCINSNDRIPIKTALHASKLYLKVITMSADIERLYFEKNIYISVLKNINALYVKSRLSEEQVLPLLNYIFNYVSKSDIKLCLIQGTSSMFVNMIKHKSLQGNIKESGDNLVKYCLYCLRSLIAQKESPQEIKCIIGSIFKCLASKTCQNISYSQRKRVVEIFKKFIKDLLSSFDINKKHYFLDALFTLWQRSDFDMFEDCIEIVNVLDEQSYKELLKRIPNYLESKNHEKCYTNLMKIVYHLLNSPHSQEFTKLDVLFSVCLRDIFLHLLNKKKHVVEKTVDILSKICILQDNHILESIFQLANESGKFVTFELGDILKAILSILENNKYASNPARNKSILQIFSKLVISLTTVDGSVASQIIYLLCQNGTPHSVKSMLTELNDLYLKLSEKLERHVRLAILTVFHKMAMHQDSSSTVFLEHLYQRIVYPSNLNGKVYGPECYSNLLLSDEFEYMIFMNKCRPLIRYDHLEITIKHLDYRQPGHCVLLNVLLEFISYKEYIVLTDYVVKNYREMCFVDNAAYLLAAFNRILNNNSEYGQSVLPKFSTIHELIWDSLFNQLCGITNIKPSFVLIGTLKAIMQMDDDELQKSSLLTVASERAYRALTLNQFYEGSVMHLTEICIALRKPPPSEILAIFENIIENPGTMALLKMRCKDTLVQLIAFFGTAAMMNRRKIPFAYKLFRTALEIPDPVVQLTTIKIYYDLATEITHEFEEIIRFCLNSVSATHPVLSRVCVLILEELIHDNYVLLNSEGFLRFMHRLGSYSLHDFMKYTLEIRFMLSNKHDIGRFYMSTLVFLSGHAKFDNYPIPEDFKGDLLVIRSLVDCPNDLIKYLFSSIQIKTKFNILKEMCSIYGSLVAGKCKVDLQFLDYFHYSLYTFKVMSQKSDYDYRIHYYGQVCKTIEKQILNKDSKFNALALYGEYETDVKYCTLTILELLFFVKNEELLHDFFFPVFDAVVCWIDHVKAEIAHQVHQERSRDYDHLLRRLIHFYKQNKNRLESFVNNQESLVVPVDEELVVS